MLFIIEAKRGGGRVGINCFTSKEAAELTMKKWSLSPAEYEISTIYPVDLETVKDWPDPNPA